MRHQYFLIRLVLLCLAWTGWSQGSASTSLSIDGETLRAVIEEIRDKHDVPALAAAILTQDGPVLIEVVGVRNRWEATEAERSDMFHLGSCTKAFTGWLAGWAVENGHLRWDSTLGEVFPQQSPLWPDEHTEITLEQLLTHHSGFEGDLPRGLNHWPRQSTHEVDGWSTKEQRVEFVELLGELLLESEPGTKYAYCNTNQILAGAMVEQVTGKPWEHLLEELLFQPLGIEEFGHGPMGQPGEIKQPWQHAPDGTPREPEPWADNPEVLGPAGRLHLSMDSWSRFVAEILRGARGNGTLLKQETYRELLKPPGYTKGCWSSSGEDPTSIASVLGHNGSNNSNYSTVKIYPAENFAVLVATNQGAAQSETPGALACHELEERLARLWRGN